MCEENKTEEKTKMIDPVAAVKVAVSYLEKVTDGVIKRSDMRLEEIVKGDDTWTVTLSHLNEDQGSIFGVKAERGYKEFVIDASNSEIKSMKIKKI